MKKHRINAQKISYHQRQTQQSHNQVNHP